MANLVNIVFSFLTILIGYIVIKVVAQEKKFNEADLDMFTRVHEIPFGFNRRRMSVVVEVGNRRLLVSKGAPESILGVCTAVGSDIENQPMSQTIKNVNALIEKYRQAGNRLIALSIKTK